MLHWQCVKGEMWMKNVRSRWKPVQRFVSPYQRDTIHLQWLMHPTSRAAALAHKGIRCPDPRYRAKCGFDAPRGTRRQRCSLCSMVPRLAIAVAYLLAIYDNRVQLCLERVSWSCLTPIVVCTALLLPLLSPEDYYKGITSMNKARL